MGSNPTLFTILFAFLLPLDDEERVVETMLDVFLVGMW